MREGMRMNDPTAKTIALFSAQYPPHVGGIETYTCNLARELETLGHHAIVVSLDNCDAESYEVDQHGIEVLRLPCHNAFSERYPVAKRTARAEELWSKLDGERIDYVVVNARFYPHSLAGVRFARKRGIAPIVIEHGSAHLTLGSTPLDVAVGAVEHVMTALVERSAPQFYAVSKAASAWLEHFGIQSKGELNNAIDAPAFRNLASAQDFRAELGIGCDDLLLASVGRLVPEKGVESLLEAMRRLTNEPVWCLFAGDGPLRATVEDCGIERVRALGSLGKPEVAALLTQADALCLPSRSEGFATSLLEAAACGTPAIVTRVGGVNELVPDARFGTVLDDASAASVERAVRSSLARRGNLADQGRAVRERVEERFTWRRTAEDALEACRRANAR